MLHQSLMAESQQFHIEFIISDKSPSKI